MNANTILWIYIGLLIVGGIMGFVKGKSKISLIMSLVFAAILTACQLVDKLNGKPFAVADGAMVLLLIVFGMRLAKTKKFMPSGMMLVVTLLAIGARLLFR